MFVLPWSDQCLKLRASTQKPYRRNTPRIGFANTAQCLLLIKISHSHKTVKACVRAQGFIRVSLAASWDSVLFFHCRDEGLEKKNLKRQPLQLAARAPQANKESGKNKLPSSLSFHRKSSVPITRAACLPAQLNV